MESQTLSLTEELKEYAKLKGVDLVGVTSADPFFVGPDRSKRDPREILPSAKAVVVAGCYVYGYKDEEPPAGSMHGRFSAWTRAELPARHHAAQVVESFLTKKGYKAIKASRIPHKMAAVRSGVAYYGKNCLVHSDDFGSHFPLSVFVTDAPLQTVDKPLNNSDCGSCTACVDACPVGALDGEFHLDRNACMEMWFWGAKKPDLDLEKTGDTLFNCGYCQNACPKNEDLKPRENWPFEVETGKDYPDLQSLITKDEAYFREVIPPFAMEAGVDLIRRNAAIALGNLKDARTIPSIVEALNKVKHGGTHRALKRALRIIGTPEALAALEKHVREEEWRWDM